MAIKDVAVGIDLGGTNTVFGFVDRQGNIHASHIGFRDEDKTAIENQINRLLQN